MIRFAVRGVPITQGSKRAFVVKGRAIVTESGGAKHKGWREAVRSEAQDQAEEMLPLGPFDGPCAVRLTFGLQKPKSAPKTRRTWPIKQRTGDVDKLARACLDSLTGVLFRDDAQVIDLRVTKDFAEVPGVVVEVYGPHELTDIDYLVADALLSTASGTSS